MALLKAGAGGGGDLFRSHTPVASGTQLNMSRRAHVSRVCWGMLIGMDQDLYIIITYP